MADKTWVPGTVIDSPWLQDVNDITYGLPSTATGEGASLVAVEDSSNWFSAVATKTVETILGWIGKWLGGRDINVFEYMTTAEIASVRAYNFSVNVTTAVQTALDAAWTQKRDLFCPAGGYNVTGLTLPGTYPTLDERDQCLRWYGQAYGNPFSTLNGGGTVFRSTTNAPIVTDRPITAPNAHGTFEIDHMRFDGTSTTPIISLDSFYGTSSLHHLSIYQRGTGDGVYIDYGATALVHDCYSVNKDFATPTIGAGRTGVGFNFPNSYGAGLITFVKCSSRGWNTGYIIGAAAGAQSAYHATIRDCECSTVYDGIKLTAKAEYCTVEDNYFEGVDGGTAIIDAGNFNKILKNNIFSGFAIGIDLQASGYGGVCAYNTIATAARPSTTVINCVLSSGLGRTVTRNTIIWANSGGAIIGVSGITVSGANGQIDLSGNIFNPKINWVGGAGSQQITDSTTSTLSAGSGQYGFGTTSFDNLQIPMLNQGAVSFAKSGTNITDVVGGGATGAVLLTAASSHVIAFTGAKGVTSFTAPNIEGKFFVVRVTNANCTFTNGASLKMAGAANYTPGAGGASVTFLMHSNIAYEVCRTAY